MPQGCRHIKKNTNHEYVLGGFSYVADAASAMVVSVGILLEFVNSESYFPVILIAFFLYSFIIKLFMGSAQKKVSPPKMLIIIVVLFSSMTSTNAAVKELSLASNIYTEFEATASKQGFQAICIFKQGAFPATG